MIQSMFCLYTVISHYSGGKHTNIHVNINPSCAIDSITN